MADTKEALDNAETVFQLGCTHRRAGQLDLAMECFRRSLALAPTFAPAALGLGEICYDLGLSEEGLQYLEQALQSAPRDADVLCACGRALADLGHMNLALDFLRKAVEAQPDEPKYTLAAIDTLQGVEFNKEDPWYEGFLLDCFDDPRLIHESLTNVATSLLWLKPAIRDAVDADDLDASHLARLAEEPLLLRLLTKTIGRSWAFEQFFTRLRLALARTRDTEHLELAAGVAEQAFNADYVQYQSDFEIALELELIEKHAKRLLPIELMVLASYRALADVPGAGAILERTDLPEATQHVIRRTLREPLREQEIQSQIVSLTPIDNQVSKLVQKQYEEHPYPRWLNIQTVEGRRERLVDEIERNALTFKDPGWPARPRVLVPGCGTGYHPLFLAQRHPDADVLAVDISRTSVAYAIRKQQELGLTNAEFRQADLLGLGNLRQRFEYIDCSGVLHHLESPIEGWRVLSDLLQPGGVMRVGLYSELARQTITRARERIAAMGIASTDAAIRDFRQAIMNDSELEELRSLARNTADFYSLAAFRDLIFHVQEHRFDLPTIERHLEALGLEFGGFLLHDRDLVRRFHSRHPSRAEWLSLACWAKFEQENPGAFYGMYQFYCLKPDLGV